MIAPKILVIDDNALDVTLTKRALAHANIIADIQVVEDGEQAVLLFNKIDCDIAIPCPDLIILDINLPIIGGLEVLEHIRKSSRSNNSRIIMVTSSDLPTEREAMKRCHAEYFQKTFDLDEYMKLGQAAKALLDVPLQAQSI